MPESVRHHLILLTPRRSDTDLYARVYEETEALVSPGWPSDGRIKGARQLVHDFDLVRTLAPFSCQEHAFWT